jgi:hypothetical protein
MEQEQINYPWEDAPDWAEYAAIDQNGRAFWYEGKPKLMYTIWAVSFGDVKLISFGNLKKNKNWKLSLQKRPNI